MKKIDVYEALDVVEEKRKAYKEKGYDDDKAEAMAHEDVGNEYEIEL